MHIEKSTVIEVPVDKTYSILSDFNHWKIWSPWLITEPEAKVSISDDAKSYEWEGKRTGSGNMSILDESTNQSIDYDLNFLKPWKSTAKVRFKLESEGENTKVSWSMDSSLPFFMFWMKKMMIALIGMDYDRGLSMLKEYAEKGEVTSKLDFKGESDFPGCQYIGINRTCELNKMGDHMMNDFEKIKEFLDANESLKADFAFSIYHKWDPANNKVIYTGAWGIDRKPDNLPDGFITDEIPSTRIHTVSHMGPYTYLGNAWSALYAMHRAKEFKPNKKLHPFEVYANDPQEVAEKDIVTDIHFPVA